MSDSYLDLVVDEISSVLEPLVSGLENPRFLESYLQQIGLRDATGQLKVALTPIAAFAEQARTVAGQSQPSFESVSKLLGLTRQAFDGARSLVDVGGTLPGATALGADLAELLVTTYLGRRSPTFHRLLVLLGVLQPQAEQPLTALRTNGAQLVRAPFAIDRLHLGRLVDLVRDPVAALKAEYTNPLATDGDAKALADKLFPRIEALMTSLGVGVRYGIHPDDRAILGDWGDPLAHALVIYVDEVAAGADADAGVVLTLAPKNQGDLGLVVSPFGALSFTRQAGDWEVTATATAGVDVVSWGRQGVTLLAGSGVGEMAASITAKLPQPAPGAEGAAPRIFGSPTGTRLEITGAQLSAEAHLSKAARSLALAASVTKATFVIGGGDGDGFTSSVLPSNGLRAEFDLGIGWATDKGLTLSGAAGLEAAFAVSESVAGVTLTHVNVGLRAADGRVETELSGTFSASLGPVQVSVERLGMLAALTFPDKGGNLGFADLALGLKAPTGAGLRIDAHGILSGGGFLSLDAATGNYGGVVQLSLHETISLAGYGLIATHMPDGRRGFSMLVFITAEGFKPIPLGFGFMLQGIGGMLGIHRTFDVEVLRSGLKSDILSTLLFPRDPVRQAPSLLPAMAAAFPIRQGSYLIGLLAQITWFTPTLVTLDLALILELGARTRLLALGRVSALLPSRDNDLVRLNLDTIGVLDFDASTFEADAVLVDSRLVHQFPITGAAALRANWSSPGHGSSFVLAVGGFNPRFSAPSGFPKVDRVAIALTSGKNPRLICEAYLAVTPNTVQFGARVSLYAEALGFSVAGDLGFDALITLVPPHFLIDFHASVQLKRGSWNLFKVTLDGTLEGPLPLRMAAKATFEILWFSFSVHFDFTLAEGKPGQGAPSIRLEDEVKKALIDPANWKTRTSSAHGVTLRGLPAGATPVLDPLGQLVVQQQVAPLNSRRLVDTYGGARVSGPQQFNLAASFDGQAAAPVQDSFAPARYFQMSDDDKVSAPSFELMDAGAVMGADGAAFDPSTVAGSDLVYDEFVLNAATQARPKPTDYALPAETMPTHVTSGAAARAPVRQVGRARFRNPAARPTATLKPQAWLVVETYGGAAAQAPSLNTASAPPTWSEAKAVLAAMPGGDRWQLAQSQDVKA